MKHKWLDDTLIDFRVKIQQTPDVANARNYAVAEVGYNITNDSAWIFSALVE